MNDEKVKVNSEYIKWLKYSLHINPNPKNLFTGKSERENILKKISDLMDENKFLRCRPYTGLQ